MKILLLFIFSRGKTKTRMRYERLRYPDGQISVKITDYSNPHIVERINSYEDLMFVKSIAEAYHYSVFEQPLSLFIPCLFGQRSDRRFSDNQSFDLKIIADVINSCNFSRVDIFDPHNTDVTLALINNSYRYSPISFIQDAINSHASEFRTNGIIISADSGSYKKCFSYGEYFKLPVVAANKYRDLSGKITLNFVGDVKDKTCLIPDDMADGAYTFVLLAKALREQGAVKIYLYVSHGFFNKGFDELKKYIDHIYCTNSVKDINDDFVTQFKVV